MANVEKYRDIDGRERFAARWRHDGKQVKARRDPKTGQPFKSERAAKKYAEEQEADARRGLTPHRSDVTVTEYAQYWATTRRHRLSTKRRIFFTIKHLSATGLGDRKLTDVRQSQVQAWVSDRAEVLARSTLKKAASDLGSIFRSAVRDKLITVSPVDALQFPEAEKHEHIVPLTVAQVRALADAMPARYRAMVLVQAGLGLRVGELLGLRDEDVNLLHREVKIEVQFIAYPPTDEAGNRLRTELKTRTSKRTLRLARPIARELAAHQECYGVGADGSVFITSEGRPVSTVHYNRMIREAGRKAGLPKGTTSHDLRHHYATELLGAGLTSVEVGHLLGHRDGTLVEKVYAHSRVDAADRSQEAMDKLWSDAV